MSTAQIRVGRANILRCFSDRDIDCHLLPSMPFIVLLIMDVVLKVSELLLLPISTKIGFEIHGNLTEKVCVHGSF